MPQTVLLSAFAGLMAANALPHFVSGITGRPYPSVTGNGPVPNAIGGWALFVIAGLSLYWARPGDHPGAACVAAALGALPMAVFHAAGGPAWVNTRSGRPNP
ncbi:hypothetical protein [Streptomyces sp. NBC_00448]|uniref:hypothetical protein n=1 Tax=Streptomyces sp. NBC_00448 TaxID=2903652 RepID=UPI002E244315